MVKFMEYSEKIFIYLDILVFIALISLFILLFKSNKLLNRNNKLN